MQMFLYKTTDENNVINKEITDLKEVDIKFKDSTDIRTPIVVLHSDEYIDFNYCYIPTFHRYYFINNVTVNPNKIYTLDLICDVLETYKEDILKSYATVIRTDNGNGYIDDDYTKEVRKDVKTIDFENPFLNRNNPNYILITAKGGK
jgi:hypothetical protein